VSILKYINKENNMEIGDTVKIRNTAGILTITLDKKLDNVDVFRGLGDDKLGSFVSCRWEFHKGKYGSIISTLYDSNGKDNKKIFVAFLEAYDTDVEIWESHFDEAEKDETIFETLV
jgi:hypothetical protein